ncbi:MAG TPA: hypothetical protein VF103_17325, partial [Polyangiaceae bacterium]
HSHTGYSDGTGTPAEAFAYARDVAHLDFMAVTEHNHAAADGGGERNDDVTIAARPELYDGAQSDSLVSAARAATRNGKFVALYGQEFSTISTGNHVNVFDVRGVIDAGNGQFRELVEAWLPVHPDSTSTLQLIQLNHPFAMGPSDVGPPASGESARTRNARMEYGADDFGTRDAWVAALDPYAELIEVFSGPALKNGGPGLEPSDTCDHQYLKYLNLGFHLAPTANQDNHHRTWGTITDARTGVIAPSLTKASLLAALKARHAYATLDKNLRFIAHVMIGGQKHLLGDIVPPPTPGTAFEIQYELSDDDEPTVSYDIDVYSDVIGGPDVAVPVLSLNRSGNTPPSGARIQGLSVDGPRRYFLLKVTQRPEHGSRDVLWTAPVWFDGPATQGSASTRASRR